MGKRFDLRAIDDFLSLLERACDDDELRRLFDTYQANFDLDVPADPFSAEYRTHQMALYEQLHGKPYGMTNERSHLDVQVMAKTPFPYIHGSASTVGDQLMGIGFLIKTMRLPKGARILEFGPGWGNTTLALAKMGYEVLAIDVEQNFVDLVRERARMERIETLEVRKGNFFDIEVLAAASFDAVLFFECFHHCDDHLRLIAAFDRVLKPGGIVCFAAEPINDEFPLPWGLRMDGQSLWAIRRNGWMELGFHIDYFRNAMARAGWLVDRRTGKDSSLSSVLLARRKSESEDHWDFAGTELRNRVGQRSSTGIVADGRAGYLMYGPYVARSAGRHFAMVELLPNAVKAGKVTVEIASQAGRQLHATCMFDLDGVANQLCLPFGLATDVVDLEVRLLLDAGTCVALKGLTLSQST